MNCILIDDDLMARRVIEDFAGKIDFINLKASFDNAYDALNYLKGCDCSIDLIFLDIEMPEMSGMDLLDSIVIHPQIIITSSKERYALQAFNYSVADYLLKPVTFARFVKAVSKVYDTYTKQNALNSQSKEMFIKKRNMLHRVLFSEILWVEAMENYIIINTLNDRFTIHLTLKSVEQQLPAGRFKRVHRSFIVNLEHIAAIEEYTIFMQVGGVKKTVPIGKSYKESLLNDINLINK